MTGALAEAKQAIRLIGTGMAGTVSGIMLFLAFIVFSPAATGESGLFGTPFRTVLLLTLPALFWAATSVLALIWLLRSVSERAGSGLGLHLAALQGSVFHCAMAATTAYWFRTSYRAIRDLYIDGYAAFF